MNPTGGLQLAELIAALSRVADLGMGQPPESAIQTCLLATNLARRVGLSDSDAGNIYYTALLQHVGCTAYAYETAALFGGDDIAVRAGGSTIDFANPKEALPYLLLGIGKTATPIGRTRAVVRAVSKGKDFDRELSRSNCEVAVNVARRLGMSDGVQRGLNEIYERWAPRPAHLLQGQCLSPRGRRNVRYGARPYPLIRRKIG